MVVGAATMGKKDEKMMENEKKKEIAAFALSPVLPINSVGALLGADKVAVSTTRAPESISSKSAEDAKTEAPPTPAAPTPISAAKAEAHSNFARPGFDPAIVVLVHTRATHVFDLLRDIQVLKGREHFKV